jgi:hypothetical protein
MSNYSVKKKTPDPQVKDVADQFYTASELLWQSEGVVLPFIINSALALELYLKSLAARSVIKNFRDCGDEGGGGIVTATPIARTHKLTELFDVVDDRLKSEITNRYDQSGLSKRCGPLRDCLQTYDDTFEKIRYVYEDSSSLPEDIDELRTLTKFMKDFIDSLPLQVTIGG